MSLATQRFTMADTKMAMPLDDLIAADPEGEAFLEKWAAREAEYELF